MKGLVSVAGKGERRQTWLADGDADLLMQLADQRLFRPLARLDLAAGKFPQPRERLALRALREQHAPVGVHQRAGNHEGEFDVGHAGKLNFGELPGKPSLTSNRLAAKRFVRPRRSI